MKNQQEKRKEKWKIWNRQKMEYENEITENKIKRVA